MIEHFAFGNKKAPAGKGGAEKADLRLLATRLYAPHGVESCLCRLVRRFRLINRVSHRSHQVVIFKPLILFESGLDSGEKDDGPSVVFPIKGRHHFRSASESDCGRRAHRRRRGSWSWLRCRRSARLRNRFGCRSARVRRCGTLLRRRRGLAGRLRTGFLATNSAGNQGGRADQKPGTEA
jgi:hypothetical protein